MSLAYTINKIPGRRFEAVAELHWYARIGSYTINVVGFGITADEAIKSADLLAGQARAALHVATIKCVHRVPETTESAGS